MMPYASDDAETGVLAMTACSSRIPAGARRRLPLDPPPASSQEDPRQTKSGPGRGRLAQLNPFTSTVLQLRGLAAWRARKVCGAFVIRRSRQ